jgi:arabinose-5-phosphate isomerase
MKLTEEEIKLLAKNVLIEESKVIKNLANQIDEEFIKAAYKILECKGHTLITGIGTSHSIALRLAHLLSCCGTPSIYISAADSLHGGSGAITKNDIVIAISKGGESKEVNKFVEIAREHGCFIIGMTENSYSTLSKLSDITIKIKSDPQADPFGMIATASSIANAAVSDALCFVLLKLRGYTEKEFCETHPGGAVGQKIAQRNKK